MGPPIAQANPAWFELVVMLVPLVLVVVVLLVTLVGGFLVAARERRRRAAEAPDRWIAVGGEWHRRRDLPDDAADASAPARVESPRTPVWLIVFWTIFVPAGLTLVVATVVELVRW